MLHTVNYSLNYCTVMFAVPDLHIEGKLEAIHAMIDKPQIELIKGLIDMNLGEPIEEFEKPSTVIRDPIAQVSQRQGTSVATVVLRAWSLLVFFNNCILTKYFTKL